MKPRHIAAWMTLCSFLCLSLSGCGPSTDASAAPKEPSSSAPSAAEEEEEAPAIDTTPVILTPEAPGSALYTFDGGTIDYSNAVNGYVIVNYTGSNAKPRLLIDTPDGSTYRYYLFGGEETFPLTAGDGSYQVSVYEQISGDQYSLAGSQAVEVAGMDEYLPYLYPNQYVHFTADTKAVETGREISAGAASKLEVIERVYDYISSNISYDKQKAKTVEAGYVPNVDDTLDSGKGICFDYASLMATMLRTQQIPTRLEVGYVKEVYHAWISTYVEDIGWINGIIQFDGETWQLMDPTFAASNGEESVQDFIGDGSTYQTKYMY